MHEPSASSEHPVSTAQRRRQHGYTVEDGVMLGAGCGGYLLSVIPFASLLLPSASPQGQLTYGAATYAAAFGTAVLLGMLPRIPVALCELARLSLVDAITRGTPCFGSFCIASALVHLAGWRVDFLGILLIGLLLWAVVVLGIVLPTARAITRRTRVHT
jgi:hypothetical protein